MHRYQQRTHECIQHTHQAHHFDRLILVQQLPAASPEVSHHTTPALDLNFTSPDSPGSSYKHTYANPH